MRPKKSYLIIYLTVIIVLLSSCSTKKVAVDCPDYSKSRYQKVISKHSHRKHEVLFAKHDNQRKRIKIRIPSFNKPVDFVSNSSQIKRSSENENVKKTLPTLKFVFDDSQMEYKNGLTASINKQGIPPSNMQYKYVSALIQIDTPLNEIGKPVEESRCDTIILKSGTLIIGKVKEIGQIEIKYSKCNNLDGPVFPILKSDVLFINYANGLKERIFSDANIVVKSQPKVEPLGLAGFISGLTGFLIAAIPLGTVAMIFGAISLGNIKKNPEKYKGKGFAIAALIIGALDVFLMLILLSAMV